MDQIRTVVVNDKAHALCQAVQGCFGEKIHSQIHIDYLTGAVIGILRALVCVRRVGKVYNGYNACFLSRLICIGVASKVGIDGRGRTVQNTFAHTGGFDHAEVCKGFVAQVSVVSALIGTNQLTDKPLFTVAALFLHSNRNLNSGFHQIIPTITRLLVYHGLLGNTCGGSKVSHIDSENYTVRISGCTQNNFPVIYVAVARAKRNIPLFISNSNLYDIAVLKAFVVKVFAVHIQDQVAVLGDLIDRGLYLNGFVNRGITGIFSIIGITTVVNSATWILASAKHCK